MPQDGTIRPTSCEVCGADYTETFHQGWGRWFNEHNCIRFLSEQIACLRERIEELCPKT